MLPDDYKSKQTKELTDAICLDIACGDSVLAACKNHGVGEKTFYVWLAKDEKLQQDYARARECRADAHFESSATLMQELRQGIVTGEQARIMLDEIKWKCAKQSAKKYGDKLDMNHSGAIKSERELTEADRALIDLAIDHKINGGKDGKPKLDS